MKTMLFTSLFVLLPFAASAGTVTFKATCSVGGEYVEIDQKEVKNDGWIESEDEYGDIAYVLETTLDTADLPFQAYIADLGVSLSKEGLLEMGMSVGDSDASAETSLQLPTLNGEILPIENLQLNASAGDHASGAWSFNCSTEISIK